MDTSRLQIIIPGIEARREDMEVGIRASAGVEQYRVHEHPDCLYPKKKKESEG
jgi:hypothetical protein